MKKMFVCAMVGMMVMGAGAQTGRDHYNLALP